MPMILLVVVRNINQSNSMGLCGSMWVSMLVYVGTFLRGGGKTSGLYVN